MLSIRPTEIADIDRIIQIEQADRQWICPYSPNKHLDCMEEPSQLHLSVWRRDDSEPIGFLIILGLNNPNLAMEFRRIVIAEKGQGYGRRCIRWVKRFCFEEKKYHRLWLDVFTDNERARQLYLSEGFRQEGHLRESILHDGQHRDLYLLAMLENDFLKNQ